MLDGRNLPKNGTGIYYWGERGGIERARDARVPAYSVYDLSFRIGKGRAFVFRFLFLSMLSGELMGIQTCLCIIRFFGGYFIIWRSDDIYYQTANGPSILYEYGNVIPVLKAETDSFIPLCELGKTFPMYSAWNSYVDHLESAKGKTHPP